MKIVDRAAATDEPGPGRRSGTSRRGRLRRRRPTVIAPRLEAGRVARARHRNPTWLVAGALLVVVSALGGVLLFSANDDRIEVLVAAAELQPGVPVEPTDLRIARVAVGDGVATVDPDDAGQLAGRQPVGRVPAGTLLSPGMFVDEVALGAGEVVVGAALDPGEAPLSGLQVGSAVELVAIELGEEQGQETAAADDAAVTPIGRGTVWAVEPIATGQLWVSVRLDRDVGLEASLASARDALRIVLIGGAA